MERRDFIKAATLAPIGLKAGSTAPEIIDVREWGDPITSEVFQAAVDDTTYEVPTNSGPRKRLHLLLPSLPGGANYLFEEPINMQNRSAIRVEGESEYQLIECIAPGVPAFDLLGAKRITFKNIGIRGHNSSPPSVGFWVGRSGLHSGGGQITFDHCYAEGNFTHAIWYNTSSEYLSLGHSTGFLSSPTGIATVYQSRYNDLGLVSQFDQPDNFSGAYGLMIWHSALTMSGLNPICPGSALIVSGANYGQIRDSYVAAYIAPAMEVKAPCTGLTIDKVAKEGTSPTWLKVTATGTGANSKVRNLAINDGGSGGNTETAIDASDVVLSGGRITNLNNREDIYIKEIRNFFIDGWANYNAQATITIDIARQSRVSKGFHNVVDIRMNVDTIVGP